MKVSNMQNANGKSVLNQFEIENDDGSLVFQSYKTVIAKKQNGKVYLDRWGWDYSKTTSKYRNLFLGVSTKEVEENIKSGKYTLVDLNPNK